MKMTHRPLTARQIWRAAALVIVLPIIVASLGYGLWRQQHPYGLSHCCDLQLGSALRQYASTNGGWLPAGEKTPEASLSLIYGAVPWVNANVLRGKTVPEAAVQACLDRGERLTPETCGWHYVEGLREDDDANLAVCWDKIGLDHFGGSLPDGGHTVLYLSGSHGTIPAAEWSNFLDQQQKLIANAKAARRPSVVAPKLGKHDSR